MLVGEDLVGSYDPAHAALALNWLDGRAATVENTGEPLAPPLVSTLVEPFRRGTDKWSSRSSMRGSGMGRPSADDVMWLEAAHVGGDARGVLPDAETFACLSDDPSAQDRAVALEDREGDRLAAAISGG